MFGFSQYADAFAAEGGVHEVRNLITLEYNVYSLFNMLQLWFESTDEVCYSVTCSAFMLTYCGAATPIQIMHIL